MLLIDIGNSRIKWALAENGILLHRGSADVSDWAAVQRAWADLPDPRKIVVSNVAGEEAAARLRAICAAWACPVEFITAEAQQCGVKNRYDEPTQLGSDRWAALIGAWHQVGTDCLVVNMGTATTVDALSAEGEFLGGLILPGVIMMRASLSAGTAQLSVVAGNWREFPRNTADAIAAGTIQATAGAIRQQYELLCRPDALCVLSGGAAESVGAHLNLPLLQLDDLVLRGLNIIGQETDK
ncbi:MAG: type III pantothenate kinase [Pseudomonadota bacterium]